MNDYRLVAENITKPANDGIYIKIGVNDEIIYSKYSFTYVFLNQSIWILN